MPVQTAGILVFRRRPQLEVFLVHNGGPFFAKRDNGFWTIPKGTPEGDEDLFETAQREFQEETGMPLPKGELIDMGKVRQVNNKEVTVWAVEGDLDPAKLKSNTFEMEWPPRSGQKQTFPEVDRGGWFDLKEGAVKLNAGQAELLTRLADRFGEEPPTIPEQVALL
jgi:predicted NUDIX family NTP pyrophosphohydrolase